MIEVPYVRRCKISPHRNWDKRSAYMWDFANAIEPIGMVLGFTNIGRIHTGSTLLGMIGLSLLVAGVAMRWRAIYTLGRCFTSVVVIKDDHRLIRTGLYRHLHLPAYTGAMLAHLGLGLSFSNWFSLALSVVPYLVAVRYRIQFEEQAMGEAFGEEYRDYSRSTKRLIPKLY